MDKPADQADPLPIVDVIDSQSPDRKVVRRRFVQSTLFPLKSATKVEISVKKEKKKVEETVNDHDDGGKYFGSQERRSKEGRKSKRNVTPQKRPSMYEEIVDNDDDDEEYCGSQERKSKRSKSKRKNTPQKRASKKVTVNEKDASFIALDDTDSLDDRSPQKRKDKKHVSARNGRTRGDKGNSTAKAPNHPVASPQASQPMPDLWQEAKRTAEENSRLFAGKQVHPFFSLRKAGKKDHVTIEVENNGCLDGRERHAVFGPIHVFENAQADVQSIDWSNWTLCDGLVGNQEGTSSCIESTVGSLNFGINLNILKPSAPLHIEDLFMGQCYGAHEDSCIVTNSDSPVIVDKEGAPYDLLRNLKMDFDINKIGLFTRDVDNAISTSEQHTTVPLESIIKSYHLNRKKHPENSLWTNKYRPEKALEVCGNSEAVKFINEWLHLWHSTDFRVNRTPITENMSLMREDEYDSNNSDSDMGYADKDSGLKNVLLVTGPVGSGKSAAIYACAKEQGFQVIEVNASDWRSGALLKQKFGEAVGSHWLKRSQENPMNSPNKLTLESHTSACTSNPDALDLNRSLFEVISLSEEDCVDEMQHNGESEIPCEQSEIKTVILFEDVDATLCEDRGFISTIQQLANTGKRPMILTSNSENPVLPDTLAREEVCFTMPTLKELIHHIYLICAAEKVNLEPCLIERCIHFCGGDIRKTLMQLQFWCQSEGFVPDGKVQTLYNPLMFDLQAGYCILPMLFPWELPSSLAVFVEAEIANTTCMINMEENYSLLEVIEEDISNPSMEKTLDFDEGKMNSIEAKKEAILRENCFQHDDIIVVRNMCDFSNLSDSPIAYARRNVRRKLVTVLSDSEDEVPSTAAGLSGVNNSPAPIDQLLTISSLDVNGSSNASDNQLCHSRAIEELKLPSGMAPINQIQFSPVGNSCKLTDNRVNSSEANFQEIPHQHIELPVVNCNDWDVANHSLDLMSVQLLYPVEGKLEADLNGTLFPLGGISSQNSPSLNNMRNQSSDHTSQFLEPNSPKTETGNEHKYDTLKEESQNCRELNMAVKRCLFPQILQVVSSNDTGDVLQNQSSDQLINCKKLNMDELSNQHLGAGIVNHSSQVATDYPGNSFVPHFLSHGQATMENVEHKYPDIENENTFSSAALDNNHPFDHLLHSVEQKSKEIQNQYPAAGTATDMGDSLSTINNQFVGIAKLVEIEGPFPGSADVKHAGCQPEDNSREHASHQVPFVDQKIESLEHQMPEFAGVDVTSCAILGSAEKPVDVKVLQFAEEHQSQNSEVSNFNPVINGCHSQDVSCVPESTFVPETEVYNETEVSLGDLMEIVSPVTNDTVDPSILKHKTSGYVERHIDLNLNVRSNEMGDFQGENEQLEASTSGFQLMDECSRMDFLKRSKSCRRFSHAAKNPVQEKWNELRQTDLRQHFISEHKHSRQVLELASGMSDLISDADLLHHCRFIADDFLGQETSLGDEISNIGWHDLEVKMASTISEHGYCFYAKTIDSLELMVGVNNRVDLARELLASTSNSMALGKLLSLGRSKGQSSLADGSFEGAPPTVDTSLNRERETCLQNTVLSIIPLKSHLAMRGNALHDYLSSLALISSSEASRLIEVAKKKKGRRVRCAKNYLSSGGLDLSADDISLLKKYNSYRRVPPNLK